MLKVADVSHHQGEIDWDLLAPAVDAVIVKAGGGDGLNPPPDLYRDTQFLRNRDEVRRRGIPLWFYWFAGCRTSQTPQSEADFYLSLVDDVRDDEALVLDYEPKDDPPDPQGWCTAFTGRVKARRGKTCVFYSNESRIRQRNWKPVVDTGAPLWAAKYGEPEDGELHGPPPRNGAWPKHIGWQYTETGHLPGIAGSVDMSQFFCDVAEFRSFGHPGGVGPVLPPSFMEDDMFTFSSNGKPVFFVAGGKAVGLNDQADLQVIKSAVQPLPHFQLDADTFEQFLNVYRS